MPVETEDVEAVENELNTVGSAELAEYWRALNEAGGEEDSQSVTRNVFEATGTPAVGYQQQSAPVVTNTPASEQSVAADVLEITSDPNISDQAKAAAVVTGIYANEQKAAANRANITANTAGVAANRTNIATNTAAIAANRTNISTNMGQIAANAEQIAAINDSLDTLRYETREGVAISIALSGIDIPDGKKRAVSVRFGHFEGENAVAVGAAYRASENVKVDFGFSHGASYSQTGFSAGITLGW